MGVSKKEDELRFYSLVLKQALAGDRDSARELVERLKPLLRGAHGDAPGVLNRRIRAMRLYAIKRAEGVSNADAIRSAEKEAHLSSASIRKLIVEHHTSLDVAVLSIEDAGLRRRARLAIWPNDIPPRNLRKRR